MLQFTNCKLTYKKQDLDSIRQKVAKTLRCRPEELKNLKIEKKSLDARKKPDIFFVYTVSFSVDHEERFLKKHEGLSGVSVDFVGQKIAFTAKDKAAVKKAIEKPSEEERNGVS